MLSISGRKKQIWSICLFVCLPIYCGLFAYQFRVDKPIFFYMVESFVPSINLLPPITGTLANFFKWNFADLVWAWALSAAILIIEQAPIYQNKTWMFGYVVAISIELGQIFELPGTFDTHDLLALTVGYFLPLLLKKGKYI